MAETLPCGRCCFCIPLRKGLIALSYAKLALDILAIVYFLSLLALYLNYKYFQMEEYCDAIATIVVLFTDAVLTVFFIIGAHEKNRRLLSAAMYCCIVWMILVLLLLGLYIYLNVNLLMTLVDDNSDSLAYFVLPLTNCVFGFLFIAIQVYVILLIRSEILKLRNQDHELVNVTAMKSIQ